METPQLYAAVAAAFSLLVFFYLGYRASHTLYTDEDYYLAGRSVNSTGLSNSLTASTISLSTGLFIYFVLFPLYGIWIIGGMISYLIGLLIFYFIATHTSVDLNNFSTLGIFVVKSTGSRRLGNFTSFVNILSFFTVLLVEFVVGVKIFSAIFPTLPYSDLVGFAVIASVVFAYVGLGGFKAIVTSDSWQFRLLAVGTAALVISTIALYAKQGVDPAHYAGDLSQNQKLVYLAFAIVMNITMPVAQLPSWQRLAATSSDQRRKGYLVGIGKSFALWFSFLGVAFLVHNSGVAVATWSDLFNPLIQLGSIYAQLLFPLLFVGLVAALLSTADSAAIAVVYSIIFVLHPEEDMRQPRLTRNKRRSMVILIAMFVLVAGLFFLYREFTAQTERTFMSLVFYLFGQLVVITPLIVSLAIGRSTFRSERATFYGVLIGWLVLSGGAFNDMITDTTQWTFIGTIVGFMIASIFTLYGLKRTDNERA